MKLETGMYVRTYDGYICKIKGIDLNLVPKEKFIEVDIITQNISFDTKGIKHYYFNVDNDIKKASYNIIDLIEVGDYVNGYKVQSDECEWYIKIDNLYWYKDSFERGTIKIKSIVTKEQFKEMEYRIDEK